MNDHLWRANQINCYTWRHLALIADSFRFIFVHADRSVQQTGNQSVRMLTARPQFSCPRGFVHSAQLISNLSLDGARRPIALMSVCVHAARVQRGTSMHGTRHRHRTMIHLTFFRRRRRRRWTGRNWPGGRLWHRDASKCWLASIAGRSRDVLVLCLALMTSSITFRPARFSRRRSPQMTSSL